MTLSLAACGRTLVYSARPVPDAGVAFDAGHPGDAGTPVDAGTISAHLRIDADDFFKLWVNGAFVAAPDDLWYTPHEYDVTLACGQNSVLIEGRNAWKQDGLDRGVIFDLVAGTNHIVSDSSWEGAVDLGPHGMPPWGSILGQSTAHWIWTWDPDVPASQKPEEESVLLKRSFVANCP